MSDNLSPAQILAAMSESERQKWLDDLSDNEKAELAHNWKFWARPDQLAPDGDWFAWLILAVRS